MINKEELIHWLNSRIKDEAAGLTLLKNHPNARAMTLGASEVYFNVLMHLIESEE